MADADVVDVAFDIAGTDDVAALYALRVAVAQKLTRDFGRGHWSSYGTEKGVAHGMRTSRVLVARRDGAIAGTLRLATKKPWAIDVSYFTPVGRAVYLHDLAVAPELQGGGLGHRLVAHAVEVARAWPAGAIRLDAYDADAGAGEFYRRCGFAERGRVTYRGVALRYYELVL